MPSLHSTLMALRRATLMFVLGLCATIANADTETLSQGVYVKTPEGLIPVRPIGGINGLNYDFGRFLMHMPQVEANRTVEFIVYQSDFSPYWSDAELRSIKSPAAGQRLMPAHIDKLADGKYLLQYEISSHAHTFVVLDTGCCRSNVFGVSLTDTKASIKEIYSDESLNPVSAEHTLASIVRGAPEDAELSSLHAQWQKRIVIQEAREHFEHISYLWQQYEEAEDPVTKVESLQAVKQSAQQYVIQYPDGANAEEVTEFLSSAQVRLDI
ncbi:hypothetical protein [Marinimicrobium sp. ABcell2]|uniref:hypothetical protein n=1 Tax=Marinimicrobium sp. ABcell2 TaxID=3069751 RepID=UPI0027B11D41|nr:hypothetical protein [Marinimicrobium sp. ABcell2]MDQ2077879.1 hypothetical protein [Marinimicrobium sp. ABcell2]